MDHKNSSSLGTVLCYITLLILCWLLEEGCFIKQAKVLWAGFKLLWATSYLFVISIFALSVCAGVFPTLSALLWKIALDEMTTVFQNATWSNYILLSFGGMTIIGIADYFCQTVLQYCKQTFSDKLDLNVTQLVLKKSLAFSMETFDNVEIYNQLNLATAQTSQQCLTLLDSFSQILSSTIQAIGMVIILFNYNALVILISIISSLPTMILSLKANKYWYKVYLSRVEKSRLIHYLKMLMTKNENVKEIKLYGVGNKIIELIKINYSKFLKDDTKTRRKFAAKKTAVQLLDEVIVYVVKIWILFVSLLNKNTLGTTILFLNSQQSLKLSITTLLSRLSGLHNSVLYLQAICALQKYEDNTQKERLKKFKGDFSKIEFVNVSFKYPNSEHYVLKNVSMTLEAGKCYSIVGFNGSGKTTLIKLLLKLYEPTMGAIYIDNIDIKNYETASYYECISAVFQDFIKYPFTVKENIAIREASDSVIRSDRVVSASRDADAINFVEQLPDTYNTKLMKEWSGGVDLSQGQWQKIAIARCLYGTHKIAIFDEPFSSIDAQSESNIIEEFAKSNQSKLSVFITHRFSSIMLADEVFVMENGKIKERGTHLQLIEQNGIYARLYNLQIGALAQL